MATMTQPASEFVDEKERRRWKRYTIDIGVRVSVPTDKGIRLVYGRGNDISVGGMAIYIAAELRVGEEIDLELSLPYSSSVLQMRGVVRMRQSYLYGVEYVKPTQAQKAAIDRACSSLEYVQ